MFMGWGRGVGKALALDTVLPNPSGWTTMGDVQIGDALLDDCGVPCNVVAVTPVQFGRQCFAVCFDDGTEIIADAEHLWVTWDHATRKAHGRKKSPRLHPRTRTTREIAETLRAQNGRETNHSVRLARPLSLPDADLPIAPYALGVWLGDGTSSQSSVTVGAEDADELRALVVASGVAVGPLRKSNTAYWFTIGIVGKGRRNRFLDGLRSLGLINNKHIPPQYLRGSESQRRALLAGLLDTDGHCDRRGFVEFTSTSRALADGVSELACSLGFKPTIGVGRATIGGRDVGEKYRVHFNPRRHVFGLARKNASIRQDRRQANRSTHRYIVDVRRVDSVPVKCIEVDSPNHMYLAGPTMVPTHNTWFKRQIWWLLVALLDFKVRTEALDPFRGVRITSIAPTLKQWKDVNWDGVVSELTGEGKWAWLGAKLDAQSGQIRFPGGSIIRPFPATAHNAKTSRGLRTDVLDADEFDDIDADVYDAIAVPWLSAPWSLGIELLGGTPTRGRHGLWWRTMQAGQLGEKLRSGELTDEEAFALPEVEVIASKFGDDDERDIILEAIRSTHSSHSTYREVPEVVDKRAVAKARANTLSATFEREWEANPDAGEGLVYPFDEAFHVRPPPPLSVFNEFHVGVDHGWVDPGCMILFGVQGHGEDAIVWALDESYESMVPNHEWDNRAEELHKKTAAIGKQATFWADPSRPDRIDAMKMKGCWFSDVDNSILAGIARVADMLFKRSIEGSDEKWCKFYVSPKCVNLIREFGLYRRKKLPDGRFGEKPEDKNNHTQDSTRYFLYGRFGAPSNYRTEIQG